MSLPVVVRIVPSPTGFLHLGTARTALFNVLFVRKNGGKIIFRFEDTDPERSEKKFETEILDSLQWLGLGFDSAEIYRQSENAARHAEVLLKLWEADKIFPCFETEASIEKKRKSARENKTNFVFWSDFRDENREKLQAKIDAGQKFVWRFRAPKDEKITFSDAVRGQVEVHSSTIGDFAVARTGGSVLYLLANAIDDADQGISHIIRGEDGISNTPKQILIFRAFFSIFPELEREIFYAHIPLVLDANRQKLSKRRANPDECVLIEDFRASGFCAEGVLNGLAFLGWHPKDTTDEIFSLDQIVEHFALEKINPAPAQYDFQRMIWFNSHWLRRLPIQKVQRDFESWAKKYDSNSTKFLHEKNLIPALELAREKSKTFASFPETLGYLLADPGWNAEFLSGEKSEFATKMLDAATKMLEKIEEKNWKKSKIFDCAVEQIADLGVKNGEFLSPLRLALSNRERSASPFEIAEVLGKSESLRRVARARESLI